MHHIFWEVPVRRPKHKIEPRQFIKPVHQDTNRVKLAFLFILVFAGCSPSKAGNSATVQVIPAPLSGYTCFGVFDDTGKAVGGSCSKD